MACGAGPRTPVRRPGGEVTRVAVLPPDNLSGGSVPIRDLRAAIELAREQGAAIFELRSGAEYFELYVDSQALAEAMRRFPRDSTWPEHSRASVVLNT